MFRPRFEDTIDSALDVVEKNITVFEQQYDYPGTKITLLSIKRPEWTHIANNMVPVKSWAQYDKYTEHFIHGNYTKESGGTHAFLKPYLDRYDLAIAPSEKWWRSREKVPGDNPYAGYLSAKNWNFNEVNRFCFPLNIL